MNCYNHPKLSSVGICQDCSKGLCIECASKYSIPICSQCNTMRKSYEKKQIIKELLFTFGFGIIVTYFYVRNIPQNPNINLPLLKQVILYGAMVYAFSSIVAGWKTLSKLTANTFLFLPIIGWLIYFLLKLGISAMIGPIMLPIRTFLNIRRLYQLQQIPK